MLKLPTSFRREKEREARYRAVVLGRPAELGLYGVSGLRYGSGSMRKEKEEEGYHRV